MNNMMMPGGAELSEKLPDEIFQLVESFKKFLREQKAYKGQKFDVDPILEVDREADELMLAFQRISVDGDINKKLIEQIRDDTTKLLRHAELAYSSLRSHLTDNPSFQNQRQPHLLNPQAQTLHNSLGLNNSLSSMNQTSNFNSQQQSMNQQSFGMSPAIRWGLKDLNQSNIQNSSSSPHNQFASTTTSQYFADLATQFESRMKLYGEQIKELKMSLDGIVRTHNADELFRWLEKQHKTLGEIGAQVYMTHERITERKEELEKMNTIH